MRNNLFRRLAVQNSHDHLNPVNWLRLILVAACVVFAMVSGWLIALQYWQLAFALPAVFVAGVFFNRSTLILKIITFLAPIYWLPGLPVTVFESFRDVLFLFFFASVVGSVMTGQLQLQRPDKTNGLMLLGLFLLTLLPAALIDQNSTVGVVSWLKAAQVVFFYICLLAVIRDESLGRQLLILFALGHMISVSYFWLEVIADRVGIGLPWELPYHYLFRGEAGLSFRRTAFSNTGAVVVPVLLSLVVYSPFRRAYQRWLVAAGLAALYGSIILSHGRAGMVSAFLVGALILWLSYRKMFFAILLTLSIVTLFQSDLVLSRFLNAGPMTQEWLENVEGLRYFDRLSGYRIGAYIDAFELAMNSPMGVGLGNYSNASTELQFQSTLARSLDIDFNIASSAHNLYLDVASEAGILAAFVVLFFAGWSAIQAHRIWHTQAEFGLRIMLSGIIGAQLITSLFEVEIFWTIMRAFPYWISLATIVMLLRRENKAVSADLTRELNENRPRYRLLPAPTRLPGDAPR